MSKKIDVLIVEDVPEMAELMKQLLAKLSGIQVSGAALNAWEARLELDRHRPDLALLDEVLPGESSIDLLKEFQEAKVPVIMVTSVEMPMHPIPPGALGRLIKPSWDTLELEQKRWESVLRLHFPGVTQTY